MLDYTTDSKGADVIVGFCDWCNQTAVVDREPGDDDRTLERRRNWATLEEDGSGRKHFCCRRCRADYWERDIERRLDQLDAAKARTPVVELQPYPSVQVRPAVEFHPAELEARIANLLHERMKSLSIRGGACADDAEDLAGEVMGAILAAFEAKGNDDGVS